MCIRGFYRLGYEVGFARVSGAQLRSKCMANLAQESFNSRLKAEGDEESTNLYLSNLPKSLTEIVRLVALAFLNSTDVIIIGVPSHLRENHHFVEQDSP